MKISKLVLTFSIAIFSIVSTSAQDSLVVEEPEFVQPAIVYPYQTFVTDQRDKQSYSIKIEDPAIIEQRLQSIQKQIPLPYNSNVKIWLDFFLLRRPSFVKKMLEDKDLYFPIFEKQLAEHGMPDELKYLSMLESGLDPKAVSRSKAVGLWQFMSYTGKEKGLNINGYVDERMHIEKSTIAACQYLRQLYNRFNDWECALASYNTGPNRIARVRNSTGFTSYWDLHPYIHPDTRAYVPQFIAITYMMHFAGEHGIFPSNTKQFVPTEKVQFNTAVDLNYFTRLIDLDIEEFKQQNTHLRALKLPTPSTADGYEVRIPLSKYGYFDQNRFAILDSVSRQFASPAIISGDVLASNEDVPTDNINEEIVRYRNVVKQVRKTHVVKRGEFLGRIADRYDVTVKEIKGWNKLKSANVRAGQKLVVYTNVKQRVKTVETVKKKQPKFNENPEPQQEEVVVNDEQNVVEKVEKNPIKQKAKTTKSKSAPKEKYIIHKVKSGDTLWSIAQRYDGVTVDEIRKLNKIKGNSVKVGQKIKIKS
jgi:membrane-bound lytic murein transglycosylase D